MINSGSPITRFTQTDSALLKADVVFARSIAKQEETVHYKNMLLNLSLVEVQSCCIRLERNNTFLLGKISKDSHCSQIRTV